MCRPAKARGCTHDLCQDQRPNGGLLLGSEPSTLDPRLRTQSSDLHPGLPAMLPGSLTLKVGRRMVFSMYRQKAMPRMS